MELLNPEFAVYLPAVNAGYLNAAVRKLPKGRRFPKGLTPQDLIFWEDNSLWHYPLLLHSIGQYRVGQRPHALLDKGSRRTSLLIGDSGGFQIGKGTLKGLEFIKKGPMRASEAVAAWRKERTARHWISEWLAEQCDYGMTIDMPLWVTSTSGAKSPFHRCSSKQLIAMTVQNLRLIEKYAPAETRWLNVVQGGVTYVDAIDWFRAVKWFQRGGWALAGSAGAAGGVVNFLITVMMMKDEGAFSAGQDWLHVLGVSTPLWAVMLTEVQRALRRENSALTISYDSSSPFLLGGRFEQACLWPELTTHPSTWVIRSERAPQRPSYAKETCRHKFPYTESPLGSRLKLNELNVREGPWEPRQFDLLSNAMLMNHNTWIHLDAFRRANNLVEANASERIPADYARCLEIVRQVMTAEDAVAATRVLEPHVKFLDALAPMSM